MNWGLIAVTVLMTAVLTGSAAAQSAPRLEYVEIYGITFTHVPMQP